MPQRYDTIGANYAGYRRPDPRIQAALLEAIGTAESIVNVGAGTGSYEPANRFVVAIEPSSAMIRQRPAGSAPVVQASAMQLPFAAGVFAAGMAILTVHHWADRARGLAELRRVVRGPVVLLTVDPGAGGNFWLDRDYFPEMLAHDRQTFPALGEVERALGPIEIRTMPIPADCTDGFRGAYWARPEAYLDPGVQAAISSFALSRGTAKGLNRLRQDLASGAWIERNRDILACRELDLGYRILVSRGQGKAPLRASATNRKEGVL